MAGNSPKILASVERKKQKRKEKQWHVISSVASPLNLCENGWFACVVSLSFLEAIQ